MNRKYKKGGLIFKFQIQMCRKYGYLKCGTGTSTAHFPQALALRLIPGHVAKLAEDKKFKADELSSQPVSCKHAMVVIMFSFPLLWKMVAHWELMHMRF